MEDQQEILNEPLYKDGILYTINEKEKTASLVGTDTIRKKLLIPRYIVHKSNKYIVTSISKEAFRNMSFDDIRFANNSELRTIKSKSFNYSNIKRITFPSSLSEFEEGWCEHLANLNSIKINPKNPCFKIYEDKFILGRSITVLSESESKEEKEIKNYDVLIYCVRDVKSVQIPSFIRNIESYAFSNCDELEEVYIPQDSSLKNMNKYSFCNASIKQITIPNGVKEIDEYCFYQCRSLRHVEIPINSELRIIGPSSFYHTSIQCFAIPPQLEIIDDYAFCSCEKLRRVEIPLNSKLKAIKMSAFSWTKIEKLRLPSSFTQLGRSCFTSCKYLKSVEVPSNSQLKKICDYAFSYSSIKSLSVPPHVKTISFLVFSGCKDLLIVEFDENSEITKIEFDNNRYFIDIKAIVMIPQSLKDRVIDPTPTAFA